MDHVSDSLRSLFNKYNKQNHLVNNKTFENHTMAESEELFHKPLDTVVESDENDHNNIKIIVVKSIDQIHKLPEVTTKKESFEYENGTGEIYMLVSLAVFTMCALISHIIHLIQMLEAYSNNNSDIFMCKFTFITTVVTKVSCVIFILVQSAFIFKYANIVLHSGKKIAIIGLMHIISTNFCFFVRTVISETAAEIRHDIQHGQRAESTYEYLFNNHSIQNVHKRGVPNSDSTKILYEQFNNLGCINVSITDTSKKIQGMQNYLAEFLYPIVIEYSLLGMTVFYVLWSSFKSRYSDDNKTSEDSYNTKHIENRRVSIFQNRRGSLLKSHKYNDESSEKNLNQFTIDCSKSTTG